MCIKPLRSDLIYEGLFTKKKQKVWLQYVLKQSDGSGLCIFHKLSEILQKPA